MYRASRMLLGVSSGALSHGRDRVRDPMDVRPVQMVFSLLQYLLVLLGEGMSTHEQVTAVFSCSVHDEEPVQSGREMSLECSRVKAQGGRA